MPGGKVVQFMFEELHARLDISQALPISPPENVHFWERKRVFLEDIRQKQILDSMGGPPVYIYYVLYI